MNEIENVDIQMLEIEPESCGFISTETENEPSASEDEDTPLWVVVKGLKPADIGIYKTWTEAQQRTNGVSGANHKKCTGLKEALDYMRAANVDEAVIAAQVQKLAPELIQPVTEGRTRSRRNREVKDYKAINSGKEPAKRDTT